MLRLAIFFSQGCSGVLDPAGVLPPGVAESVPAFLFFFFFFGIRAGGLVKAARNDRYDPHVRHKLSGRSGLQKTRYRQWAYRQMYTAKLTT